MTGCRFAHDDAAYVLGALPGDERREYEAHLASCQDCRNAVHELAGLPGLLRRVDPESLQRRDAPEPAPATLLPRLLAATELERRRRGRRMVTLAAAALVAVLAVAVPTAWVATGDRDGSGRAPVASPSSVAAPVPLRPVGEPLPITASVGLTDVAWGTRVHLRCSYAPASYSTRRSYLLVAVSRDGQRDELGSWMVGPGEQAELDAATRFARRDLAALEIQTVTGRPLLRAEL